MVPSHKLRSYHHAVISWGSRSSSALNGNISVNKLGHLKTWSEAGLSTLTFSEQPVDGWFPRSGTSYGGGDFEGHLFRPSYYTKPIPSRKEYRLHVVRNGRLGDPAGYKVIRAGWKSNVDPDSNRIIEGIPIRSRQFGWRLQYYARVEGNIAPSLDLLCRWAIASIGWDFGAVDVIWDGSRHILLEANSCPGLRDDNTCKAYVQALRGMI